MVCTPLYAGGGLNQNFDTPPPIFGFPKIKFGVWCRIFFFSQTPVRDDIFSTGDFIILKFSQHDYIFSYLEGRVFSTNNVS